MIFVVAGSLLAGVVLLVAGLRSRSRAVSAHHLAELLAIDGQQPLIGEESVGWLTILKGRRTRLRPSARHQSKLANKLEASRIALRPTEALVVAGAITALTILISLALTNSLLITAGIALAVPFFLWNYLSLRVKRRRKALEEQLPEALSIMASSLRAGHTLHRAIESYALTGEPPLSEEFAQVIAETHLGNSVVSAVQNMSERVQLQEAAWLARAITIQYTVGGRLADLLDTLSEITYGRQQLHREVGALTAEGRASAWMLGGLPPALLVLVQITNPSYLEPMFSGWGLAALLGAGLSVVAGIVIIRRMVDMDV